MEVLNPELYHALCAAFPNGVKISGQGVPFLGRIEPDVVNAHRTKVIVVQAGEYYCVCCPYCGDTRHRLWINHRWGSELIQGKYKTTLRHLAHCYNENCESREDFKADLKARITGRGLIRQTVIMDKDMKPEPLKPLELTGKYIRVDKLPKQHAAVRYIEQVRHMNVEELGSLWDVVWFEYSPILPPNNRLFVPYYVNDAAGNKMLVGGQAHWLDVITLNGTPPKGEGVKWFTLPGSKTSQSLFNYNRAAKQSKLVVIVEGPFDAMVLGPEFSIALFGHSVSHVQKQLLYDTWAKEGAAVLALDPDVAKEKKVIELEQWFSTWPKHTILRVPDGKDIGDYSRDNAWKMIAKTGILDSL